MRGDRLAGHLVGPVGAVGESFERSLDGSQVAFDGVEVDGLDGLDRLIGVGVRGCVGGITHLDDASRRVLGPRIDDVERIERCGLRRKGGCRVNSA